ncbi:phenylalanine--tRNA ligase subunit alpha [Mesoplasma entomophilum]|uniref:Phenylalanine--tRNA ligase alpha subunit n=1 Tax=Mesoplasma entomophilum TaxID=2149 RepID=A0A3S5XZS9_9MOLU|nr:phenylalanine--tRNA ligase subunit alpha [Mesoplasma entomophilum]ATQ35557.1 phenylalanine--tRNA ligase subunit alpha [Mesoplasma entomophilum]ATZ19521.1 phenylalanyl-tRNA synthetase subunit alpha [Mesoplasma entomophilum]AVN60406.1 phenylalanine--tRNA ligase subunit alpha [Mesoplasma entomophilum]
MIKKINKIKEQFVSDLNKVKTVDDAEKLKKSLLGKESELSVILKSLKDSDAENKQAIGIASHELRTFITSTIDEFIARVKKEELDAKLASEKIDVSLTGSLAQFGTKHPLNIVVEEITQIFTEIGFDVLNGNDVESDEYCFQKLNLPVGHPARDMQDTFYINEETVLSTHCTHMTARVLTQMAEDKNFEGNYACVAIGNVYRRDDDDATHSHQFMQLDLLCIGKKITFANLKWVLKYMCKRLFGEEVNIRLRPSLFPFTEPSVEVDVSCFKCAGQGCSICKYSGWIEILGSGIINEQVMLLNGMDPEKNTALAFGAGIERIAMLKFGISNIRNLYENNVKFLEQFKFYGE